MHQFSQYPWVNQKHQGFLYLMQGEQQNTIIAEKKYYENLLNQNGDPSKTMYFYLKKHIGISCHIKQDSLIQQIQELS